MAAKNIKGLVCELKAQTKFANNPDLIVFIPLGGLGPVDMVTLNKKTGEYKSYDVKALNRRIKGTTFVNRLGQKVRRNGGTKISRPLTSLQRKLGVKIIYED